MVSTPAEALPRAGFWARCAAWSLDAACLLPLIALLGASRMAHAFAEAGAALHVLAGAIPRLLITGGGRGLGPGAGALRALDRSRSAFRITMMTGMNHAMQRRLADQQKTFNHALRIVPYTHNMASFMRRSSLLIGKPGGLTCAESMALGLPMLIVRPLPGQERGNADELVRHGAAIRLRKDRELPAISDLLLGHPELLRLMSAQALSIGRPHAAMDIAREVMNEP